MHLLRRLRSLALSCVVAAPVVRGPVHGAQGCCCVGRDCLRVLEAVRPASADAWHGICFVIWPERTGALDENPVLPVIHGARLHRSAEHTTPANPLQENVP